MGTVNPLCQVSQHGQSLWLDFIQRSLLDSGKLKRLIEEDDLRGLTSNPAIFEQAIAGTSEYDTSIAAANSKDPLEIFQHLAIEDIQAAADIFHPVFDTSRGDDGMVSLEVSPKLAHDRDATVAEALDLHSRVQRPNLMIKVPGTKAGVEAFSELTRQGINVNVTLLFSVERYREICHAYIKGLEARLADGNSIAGIASVASFFISRVDSSVDAALNDIGTEAANALIGQIAIANAKVAYGHFNNVFNSPQFNKMRELGALPQRLLWASTSTKNPAFRDVYYIEELIGQDTVNTVPPATLDAFRDHGIAADKLAGDAKGAEQQLTQLQDLGVDLSAITQKLEADGVESFDVAFDRMLEAIRNKLA